MNRRSPKKRGPGRPRFGDEPLDERLTVLLSKSMKDRLAQEGNVADFVRRAIGGKLRSSSSARKNPRRRRLARR